MKKNLAITYMLSLCLLAGCGADVGKVSYPDETAILSSQSEEATETTLPPTEPTTENVIHEKPEGAILTYSDTLEIHSELTLNELLAGTNVTLNNGDEIVDTSEIGDFDATVSYTFNGILYEHSISYSVTDTIPPVLLNSGGGSYVQSGEAFDLNDYVGFADNYDRTPTLTYTGSVDTSVCGTYPLQATAADSSGNTTSWELNIKVVNEIPTPEDTNARISFDTLTQQYAADNVELGIDVSKWQGDIDFQAVKNAGCSFVIMRVGTYYDEFSLDKYYLANIDAAKAAGLDVGVYIYTTANTEEEARLNAQWVIEQLDGRELDFPIVFDWESFSNFQQYEMSIDDLNRYFEAFADETEKNGYSAMLYSSKNFLKNFWYEHSDYPKWLAHYIDRTDYSGEYSMWQMSCFGRIDGIDGDVDFNILYTDKPMN